MQYNLTKLFECLVAEATNRLPTQEKQHFGWTMRWTQTPKDGAYRGFMFKTKGNADQTFSFSGATPEDVLAQMDAKIAELMAPTAGISSSEPTAYTIDFNKAFAEAYITGGETVFWDLLTIDGTNPAVAISNKPISGGMKLVDRRSNSMKQYDTPYYGGTVSRKVARKFGLQRRMRYTVGSEQRTDDGVVVLQLKPHSRIDNDRMVLNDPALTVN